MTKGLTVAKWGNGRGVRLPQAILNLLSIDIGDELLLEVEGDKIVLTPAKPKKIKTLKDLFASYSRPSYQELFGDEMEAWEGMDYEGKESI